MSPSVAKIIKSMRMFRPTIEVNNNRPGPKSKDRSTKSRTTEESNSSSIKC